MLISPSSTARRCMPVIAVVIALVLTGCGTTTGLDGTSLARGPGTAEPVPGDTVDPLAGAPAPEGSGEELPLEEFGLDDPVPGATAEGEVASGGDATGGAPASTAGESAGTSAAPASAGGGADRAAAPSTTRATARSGGGSGGGQGGGGAGGGSGGGAGGGGGGGAGGGGGGGAGGGGGRQPTQATAVGPGVTDKEIAIGISLFDPGDVSAKIGTEAAYGNTKKQAQAVVDWVNANGGIAGRRVRPVYYNVDFGRNPGTFKDGQFEQEACAMWTEDDKVFAAVNNTMARLNLLTCLAQRDVLAVHDAMPVDEATAAKYRNHYYNLAAPTLERRATFSINAQGQAGAFRGAVVGIMYYNDPSYKRIIDGIYIPLLKKHGATNVVLQAAARGGTQEAPSAVSNFRRNGVTHVTFFGEAGAYPLFFMNAAENQLYRPKYFFNSDHQLLILQDATPKEQLRNVTGQGWMPALDVNNANDPGPVSKANELCLEIQRKAGQDMSVRGARYTAQGYCGGLFFFKQVLDQAPSITSQGFAEVVARLGGAFQSPAVFGTWLDARRHDAPIAYRDFAYRDSGFYYTSPVRKMQ